MNGEIFKALMLEAVKVFGPVSTWESEGKVADVAKWTKRTVEGIRGPAPRRVSEAQPSRSWHEPEDRPVSQFDEFGKL